MVEGFKGEQENLVGDSVLDGDQVSLVEDRSDVTRAGGFQMIRGAAFWTTWILRRVLGDRPVKREMQSSEWRLQGSV